MQKETRAMAGTVAAAGALPAIMEGVTPGTGAAVATVLGPVAGLGVIAAGVGMMMRCI